MTSPSELRTSEPGLAAIELTPEQRKRAVEIYRDSNGSYHDLGMACAHVVFLRDRVRELESHNATLERSNARLRAKLGQWGKR